LQAYKSITNLLLPPEMMFQTYYKKSHQTVQVNDQPLW